MPGREAPEADSLPRQNGELTMLGEITHLQGIIDDLVVLTAEPHKLPPASEQVRPAPGTAGLGWGQRRRQWENVGGISWAQKSTPVSSRGTCPHEQGVCPGPSGASHRADGWTSRIHRARLRASQS